MTEPNSKPEKSNPRRFSQQQYDRLKRCSDNKDMTEWNQWRNDNPAQDVLLEGADLKNGWLRGVLLNTKGSSHFTGEVHLEGADLNNAYLDNADFWMAHLKYALMDHASIRHANLQARLQNAKLRYKDLSGTNLFRAHLEGADFNKACLKSARFTLGQVSGETNITSCKIDRLTDFSGVALSNICIEPGLRQLLEYNIRRMNWEVWYDDESEPIRDGVFIFSNKKIRLKTNKILTWLVRKFWEISDYGISTKGIIKTFFKWAFIFAIVYYAWGFIDYHFIGNKDYPGIVSNLFVLDDSKQAISGWLVPIRAVYFSIVTMTTLGLGDMFANAHSLFRGIIGHILLALQVILGYVLLGALVTRFAVLFTAGGPAGKFADEKEKEDEKK